MSDRCKHCLDGVGLIKNDRDDVEVEIHVVAKHLIALVKGDHGFSTSVSTPISFCPMCGRDLNKEGVK